jgi:UbiD family decarboxylase
MAYKGLRDWMAKLEEMGQLKRITAEVDWDLELSAIAREVLSYRGPALLFENIKDYKNTLCRKFFTNGLGSMEKVAAALGLPETSSPQEIVLFLKENYWKPLSPVTVDNAPVKENVLNGSAIDLTQLPVPRYNSLDGGRYINTYACVITKDPDTNLMNVGTYRGMICPDKKSIAVLLARPQHWGQHFLKYKERGEEMPVAVVYGTNPVLLMCAGDPIAHPGYSEYEVVGGLCREPMELVKCETSDLYVPAHAEIVIEGRISPDPETFQMEGPFGEYTGLYGGKRSPKPVIRVECITYRNDPIFRGGPAGSSPGRLNEGNCWHIPSLSAILWKYLEDAGVPNVTGVWGSPAANMTNVRVGIKKIYRGHAKQVAAALIGGIQQHVAKNIVVLDDDIDITNDDAVEWAIAYRTNAEMRAFQFYPGTLGSPLDPSTPLDQRDVMKYGQGIWCRVLIDATVNWQLEPEEQFGGLREPPLCTVPTPEVGDLIRKRWHEYGF